MDDLLSFSIVDAWQMLQSSVRTKVNDIELDGHLYVPHDDEENQRVIATELGIDYVELNEALRECIIANLLADDLENGEFDFLSEEEQGRIVRLVGGSAMVAFMAGVLYQQQQVEVIDTDPTKG